MNIYDAMTGPYEYIDLNCSKGRYAAEPVILYPPDIPVLIPGEIIDSHHIEAINEALVDGIQVIGLNKDKVKVIKS